MTRITDKQCVPCKGDIQPLKGDGLKTLQELLPEWTVVDEHHLARHFKFKNFAEALEFVNRAGAVAEEENHHPNISFTWGKVDIEVWTHKIDGLTESDFVLAAKIGECLDK